MLAPCSASSQEDSRKELNVVIPCSLLLHLDVQTFACEQHSTESIKSSSVGVNDE